MARKREQAKTEQLKTSRYRDIAAELQKAIRLGTYPVGDLLPTETELMARYKASRQTVREALRIIIEQGLIVRRAGLGSVVIAAEPPVLFTHSVKSLDRVAAIFQRNLSPCGAQRRHRRRPQARGTC